MRSLHRRDAGHLGWDRGLPPVLTVEPGTEVELHLADCFDGQLGPGASAADLGTLDMSRANPLTGPVFVEGAEPGDVLAVEVLDVEVSDIGWTAVLPGFGLLTEDFPDPAVFVSRRHGDAVDLGGFARIPLAPFIGTLGLAPAGPGPHDVIPPRRVGGNMDCRDIRPGATLLLPVEVPGAYFSAGDAHAAQGDGEVCGTAIEASARLAVRFEVRRPTRPQAAPQLQLPADAPPARGRRHVTTGVAPDPEDGARDATRAMIDVLATTTSLDPVQAYALCSVAGHLRIVEAVNAPNWLVAMELDLATIG